MLFYSCELNLVWSNGI